MHRCRHPKNAHRHGSFYAKAIFTTAGTLDRIFDADTEARKSLNDLGSQFDTVLWFDLRARLEGTEVRLLDLAARVRGLAI